MHIDPIDITIHLDLKHSVNEVQQFLTEQAFEKRFHSIYYHHYNQKLTPIEHEIFSNDYKATLLTQLPTSITQFKQEIQDYSTICGSLEIPTIDDKNHHFYHFLLPSVAAKEDKLALIWEEPSPALMIDVHRSKYEDHETFYAQIKTSHGVWGTRHQWLQGFLKIIELQLEVDEFKKRWQKKQGFIENLSSTYEIIKKAETEILKLTEMKELIWQSANEVINLFTCDENCAYVSPTVESSIDHPVDVQTYTPSKIPTKPLNFPDKIWIDLAWHECFTWDAPNFLKQLAIDYWVNYEDEDEFLELLHIPRLGWKGTWPTLVEIIGKRPETNNMIDELVKWVADPNWPGAGEAMTHLFEVVGLRAIPSIDKNIEITKKIADDWWEEILVELKKDILEANK